MRIDIDEEGTTGKVELEATGKQVAIMMYQLFRSQADLLRVVKAACRTYEQTLEKAEQDKKDKCKKCNH